MAVHIVTDDAQWADTAGATRLSELLDVDLAGLVADDGLVWDGTAWIASAPRTQLSDLLDVDLTGLVSGKTLTFNGTSWVVSEPAAAALQGQVGKSYRLVAAPLRNDGSPNYWQPISDSGHDPTNIGTVSSTASQIVVNHGVVGLKVVSSLVVPDETLAAAGYTAGASVGTSLSNVTVTRYGAIGDYVSYNGSAWTAALGASSPFTAITFSGGVLTLTHADVGDRAGQTVAVSGRGGGYIPMLQAAASPVSQTQVKVEFYDFAGAKVSAADTNMKVFVERGCGGKVDPRTITTTLLPSSNLWFLAIVEV